MYFALLRLQCPIGGFVTPLQFCYNVKDEQLDFTKVTGQTHPAPAERPGFHRLADKDPEARNNSWTRFFSGICNVICGLREKSKVDSSTAREDYYVSDTTHGMMIKIHAGWRFGTHAAMVRC